VLKVLRENDPQSYGYRHVCRLLDDFTHLGPDGTCTCLVFEAIGLSVLDLYHALPGAMPLPLLKRLCKHVQVLHAVCYVHDKQKKSDPTSKISVPPPP